MQGYWVLLGAALALNALFAAPFAHLHRSVSNAHSHAVHWHMSLGGDGPRVGESEPGDAVELQIAAASSVKRAAHAIPVPSVAFESPAIETGEVYVSVSCRSHDPPLQRSTAPRAPPSDVS